MAGDIHAGFIALNRFGLGSRRDGDLAAASSDPRGFLRAELAKPGIALLEGAGLPRTPVALQHLFTEYEQKRLARLVASQMPTLRARRSVPCRRAARHGGGRAGSRPR